MCLDSQWSSEWEQWSGNGAVSRDHRNRLECGAESWHASLCSQALVLSDTSPQFVDAFTFHLSKTRNVSLVSKTHLGCRYKYYAVISLLVFNPQIPSVTGLELGHLVLNFLHVDVLEK